MATLVLLGHDVAGQATLTTGAPKEESPLAFRRSRSPKPSPEVTVEHYARTSEELDSLSTQGDLDARVDLGWRHLVGERARQDWVKAFELFRSAAEAGNARGMKRLAECYCYGWGVERSVNASLEWNKAAAEQGNAEAMSSIGFAYFNGYGVVKDLAQAREWYEKSARAGGSHGFNNLGYLYSQGLGIERDLPRAVECYQEAARLGNPAAMRALGFMSLEGLGLPKDPLAAAKWFREAGDRGVGDALAELASLHATGVGVTRNEPLAREIFFEGAGYQSAYSMRLLGAFHHQGIGGEVELLKAFYWYGKAAQLGDAEAMTQVARMLAMGEGGTPVDYDAALGWLEQAERLGHPGASELAAAVKKRKAQSAEKK